MLIRKQCQPLFEVLLNHIDPALDAFDHRAGIPLDPSAVDALAMLQIGEQLAITAAQVEHIAIGLHPVGETLEIRTVFKTHRDHYCHAKSTATRVRSPKRSAHAISSQEPTATAW